MMRTGILALTLAGCGTAAAADKAEIRASLEAAIGEYQACNRAAMEAAWRSPEGQRATGHLAEFVDLSRSTWSMVSEEVRR